MSGVMLNPLSLLLGVLIGVGGVIVFFRRLDRTGESRIFYNLLLTLLFLAGAALMLGAASS